MIIRESQIEDWIEEDVPGIDLTSHLLGMKQIEALFTIRARHHTIVSGCREAGAILSRLGATVEFSQLEGNRVSPGETILSARGDAAQLHAAWRISMNLLEYASGIAGRTQELVAAVADAGRPMICGTRKAFPGGRRLAQQALIAGGGIPHRMGLGETVLVFANHYRLKGFDHFLTCQLPELRITAREKKIAVEVEDHSQALQLAEQGIDLIQLDKLNPEDFADLRQQIRQKCPETQVIATGGIQPDNARLYAEAGADIMATSWMYNGRPADLDARITAE